MRNLITIVFTVLFVLPGLAMATGNGYLFVGGGTNSEGEEIDSFGPAGNMRTDNGSGGFWAGGFGYAVDNELRLELELGRRSNSIDGVTLLPTAPPIAGIGIADASGDIHSLSVLVNGWYDFPMGERWKFMLGGGIGAAQLSIDNYTLATFPIVFDPPITTSLYADDEEWVFAYQAGAGISYGLTERLNVDLSYRYFATSEASFKSKSGNEFEMKPNDNRALLSLRYAFP